MHLHVSFPESPGSPAIRMIILFLTHGTDPQPAFSVLPDSDCTVLICTIYRNATFFQPLQNFSSRVSVSVILSNPDNRNRRTDSIQKFLSSGVSAPEMADFQKIAVPMHCNVEGYLYALLTGRVSRELDPLCHIDELEMAVLYRGRHNDLVQELVRLHHLLMKIYADGKLF